MRLAFLALSLVWSTLGVAGDSILNGGDRIRLDTGAAYFPGRAATYCIERDQNFSISVDVNQAKQVFEEVVELWQEYMLRREVDWYRDHSMKISPEFQFLAVCDGSEDLKIYLGSEDEQVRKHRAKYLNPTAFAQRTTYDPETGRGKGFIWVANEREITSEFPDWSDKNRLFGVFSHELGHVLGCGHIPGTIMDPDLNRILKGGDAKKLKSIDHSAELASRYHVEIPNRQDSYLVARVHHDVNIARDNFTLLMGRPPVGETWMNLSGPKNQWHTLTVGDSTGVGYERFYLKFPRSDAIHECRAQSFYTVVDQKVESACGDYMRIVNGYLETKNNGLLPVQMELGTQRGFVHLVHFGEIRDFHRTTKKITILDASL